MDELAGVVLIAAGVADAIWAWTLQRRGLPRTPDEGVPTPTGEPVGDAVAEELFELQRRPRVAIAVLYAFAVAAVAGGIALLVT